MARNTRQGAIPSELGWLIDELDGISARLRTLETPSGEALASTVAKLQSLVADIQSQLDAWTASRYTNAQIDSRDAAVQAQIDPAVNAGISSMLAGSPAIAGSLQVAGAFNNPPAYNTDITWVRRGAWVGNDGRLGYASSSRAKKTAIEAADEATLCRILEVEPKTFRYRAEIRRRTNERINYGRDYVPPIEVGLIAEELNDAGLGAFVYHDSEGNVEGIEYSMLTVALLAIARNHEQRIQALEEG